MPDPDSVVGTLTLTRGERISGNSLGLEPAIANITSSGCTRFVLIGDETALPAIARWIDLLPAEAEIVVLVEIAEESDAGYLDPAQVNRAKVCWLRAGDGAMDRALRHLSPPSTGTYFWAGGRDAMLRRIQCYLRDELGIAESHLGIEYSSLVFDRSDV